MASHTKARTEMRRGLLAMETGTMLAYTSISMILIFATGMLGRTVSTDIDNTATAYDKSWMMSGGLTGKVPSLASPQTVTLY
jgi:hypothetical protein